MGRAELARSSDSAPSLTDNAFSWPTFPLPATLGTVAALTMAVLVLIAARRFDTTGGLLTLSIMIVAAFISVTFTALLYDIKQTPLSEILVGAMATSIGAVIAFWMSRRGD